MHARERRVAEWRIDEQLASLSWRDEDDDDRRQYQQGLQ